MVKEPARLMHYQLRVLFHVQIVAFSKHRVSRVLTNSDTMRFRNTANRLVLESMPRFPIKSRRFQRAVLAAIVCHLVLIWNGASSAQASGWMFRRSYYSHKVPAELEASYPRPISRSAYRRPYIRSTGYAVRGGYRYNRIFLRSGNSTDLTVIREDWFEHRP